MRILLVVLFGLSIVFAGEMKIGAGAGYKAPVMEIIESFEKAYPHKVNGLFGNMKQINSQAAQGDIALIIGDKSYLEEKSGLPFENYTDVGSGKAVLAYAKGVNITKLEDIVNEDITRVVMLGEKKAIYGIAAAEVLERSGLRSKVAKKMLEVATVPQAATYILTGEVDAGFINLTAALSHKDRLGGYMLIDEKLYSPIIIIVGQLAACKEEVCLTFLEYVKSPEARSIFERYGL